MHLDTLTLIKVSEVNKTQIKASWYGNTTRLVEEINAQIKRIKQQQQQCDEISCKTLGVKLV